MRARKLAQWMLVAGISGSVVLTNGARAETEPKLVLSPVEKVFVPLGFDNNDNVEIVLHGHFRNSCYKVGPAHAKVNHLTKKIHVTAYAYKYPATCLQALVSFTQVVKLGTVDVGDYKILLGQAPDLGEVNLNIVKSRTVSPDDFLYAPVSEVNLAGNEPAGQPTITVSGSYPFMFRGCMILRDVRVQQTPGNVLVVQPVAEYTEGDECLPQTQSKSFAVSVPLAERVHGDNLIHVRVLNGDSLNRVVEAH